MQIFEQLQLLFSLAPVFKGFIALCFGGIAFPLCGVMVIRLNLFSMRYMLMHGVILGGAIALAFSFAELPVCVIVNLILVLLMLIFSNKSDFDFGSGSMSIMILSMAFSGVLMHVKNVQAKDTLSLFWGSPFALTNKDVYVLVLLSFVLLLYVILNFKNILCLFFDPSVAKASGINVEFHKSVMVLFIAFTVAIAMKLLGAFLIDSLLILPVMIAENFLSLKQSGVKKIFILSSICGFVFSVLGYLIALILDFPPASTISLISGLVYIVSVVLKKIKG